jgi:Fe-S-cluster-containing dehydrogenase component
MSLKRAILVDMDKCIGCNVCVVGCRQFHPDVDKKRIQVQTIGPQRISGRLTVDYFPQMTEHCIFGPNEPNPECVSVCPVHALTVCDEAVALDSLSDKTTGRYQICKVA